MNITDEEEAHIYNFSKKKTNFIFIELSVSFLQTTTTQIANFKTCMDKV